MGEICKAFGELSACHGLHQHSHFIPEWNILQVCVKRRKRREDALVLQKHACDDEHTTSLHTIQFDNNLNEIVDIGSQIEIVNVSRIRTERLQKKTDV